MFPVIQIHILIIAGVTNNGEVMGLNPNSNT